MRSRSAVTSASVRHSAWRLRRGPAWSREVHAGQRAHRAAEPEERVAAAGRGQDPQQVVAHQVAEGADLARGRRVSAQEPPRHAHGADGDARGRGDAARADLGELEAAAAEVADDALLHGQVAHRRERAQASLFPIAQQAHVRSVPLLQDLAAGSLDSGRLSRPPSPRP